MKENINFKKITRKNLNLASEIQNKIFPEEDGTQNFIDCIEKNPYRKELDFYIAFDKELPIRSDWNIFLQRVSRGCLARLVWDIA